ncbi:MAG: ribonuclease III [Bryobacterales bacterium]|nr:ribonuclease III [Bryobacteraceae bacterium]MDW8131944.1 ribonuclease III [Bryobacterales bacterium]
MAGELDRLEAVLGYRFSDRTLLERALTHPSHAYEATPGAQADNQRLEFLGDAVLGLLASEHLIRCHPEWREGRLSAFKNYLVSAPHLARIARRMGLGEHLRLGRGEELSGGRDKAGLLADALEAVLAAIYLDGGLEAARAFAERHLFEERPASEPGSDWINYKGALQETARELNLPAPRYAVVAEQGPPHARRFTVEVRLGADWSARGEGASKKAAGQQAARTMLMRLLSERP